MLRGTAGGIAAVALFTAGCTGGGSSQQTPVIDRDAGKQCESFQPDLDEPFAGFVGTYVDPTSLSWPTATPADEGVDAAALEAAGDAMALSPVAASFLVARHGRLVYERYFHGNDAQDAHGIHSLSKSILSTLVGIAIADGALTLDTTVGEVLPPELVPANGDLRVRDLLTMSGGLEVPDPDYSYPWEYADFPDGRPTLVRSALASRRVAEPGSKFAYNTGLTQVLGAMVAETTGVSLCQFAAQRLFGPLGIDVEQWHVDPAGYFAGGHSLWMTPREIAAFGQLILDRGVLGGRQVVPAGWVDEMLTVRWDLRCVAVPVVQRYGYLWWGFKLGGHDVWIASGYGAQDLAVIEDLDLVAVVTHDTTRPDGLRVPIVELLYDVLLGSIDGQKPPAAEPACEARQLTLHRVPADRPGEPVAVAGWPSGVLPASASPDGERFVTSRRFAAAYDLYTVAADGTLLARLTAESEPDVMPAWSPDGRLIAFARGEPSATDLYLIAPDGTGLRRLTDGDGFEESPAWSPDGRRLAYVQGHGKVKGWGHPGALWLIDRDGAHPGQLVAAGAANPAWSPDGSKLAFERSGQPSRLVIVDLEHGSEVDLGEGVMPRWSPDGRSIAFVRPRGDGGTDLYSVAPDGRDLRQLTDDAAFDTLPVWSADGTSILYSSRPTP